jgi:hypothetical protein
MHTSLKKEKKDKKEKEPITRRYFKDPSTAWPWIFSQFALKAIANANR